jgi:hypothetical protein
LKSELDFNFLRTKPRTGTQFYICVELEPLKAKVTRTGVNWQLTAVSSLGSKEPNQTWSDFQNQNQNHIPIFPVPFIHGTRTETVLI